MNWKKRYDKIAVGDMVTIIKEHPKCEGRKCFSCIVGIKKDKPYKVISITSGGEFGTHAIKTERGNCSLPPECLQKA